MFVDKGFVTEEQISTALARQLQVPYVNLKHFSVTPEVATRLPETQARRFRAMVLEDTGAFYRVAMADPTDLFAYDEIARVLKRDIQLAVVTESRLLQTIDRVYRRTEQITGLAQELGQELGETAVDFAALGIGTTVEDAPVVRLLQTVFEDAVGVRASDIHIEPQETRLIIRFRIDGVLHVQTEADIKIASALVLRLKLMSGLDISEKRLPQDGRFNVKVRNNQIDVRISTMPMQFGESVVMRLLNHSSGLLTLDRLGMPPDILLRVREAVHRPSGMILVTGPTGSGKTTTLYCRPGRDQYAASARSSRWRTRSSTGCRASTRSKCRRRSSLRSRRILRSALRQDPDVILVGEMRDQETAEIGLRAAMTGHMVLSTLHTNDAMSTPIRLLDMGAPRYMVAMSLQLVLAQRLVRVVCESCVQDHHPLPGEREWLRHELGDTMDQHKYLCGAGCSQCNNTGYLGRSGVYEMLEMTRSVVEAANDSDPARFLEAARAQMAGRTLRRHAIALAVQGRTTVEEAMRVSTMIDG